MGLREIFAAPDIDVGVNKCRMTPGGVLLDVRNRVDYEAGHVPGAKGIPLPEVEKKVEQIIRDKNAPVFVYCYKGGNAHRAIRIMRKLGYTSLENIGGFNYYNGRVER